jgi:hypothetical protein
MKRILSILFLMIFLFNLAGYFVVFKMMQYSAREEMKTLVKKNIPLEKLLKIVVPAKEINSSPVFRFLEENEFIYKGKRYDIVKQSTEGNNTIFYCINDTSEERLYAGLDDLIRHTTDQNTTSRNRSNILLKNIVKEALPDDIQLSGIDYSILNIHFDYHSFFTEQFFPVPSPPPKAC